MESPQLIRVGILLSLLSFASVWYAQTHFFNLVSINRVTTQPDGFKVTVHTEFTMITKEAYEEKTTDNTSLSKLSSKERPEWMNKF